jgi:hypothetical protein
VLNISPRKNCRVVLNEAFLPHNIKAPTPAARAVQGVLGH